ncbi:MAG: hypothetical protein H5T71_00540 [Chloroflexi bacterium]|nr:hypothetical protein [Chloroflexota bacterium]
MGLHPCVGVDVGARSRSVGIADPEGQIVEGRSHEELMARGGLYRPLNLVQAEALSLGLPPLEVGHRGDPGSSAKSSPSWMGSISPSVASPTCVSIRLALWAAVAGAGDV